MTHELMSLETINALQEHANSTSAISREYIDLFDTARAAHKLKAENEKLRTELEAANKAIARHEKLHRQGPRDAVDLG